jgi:hypothetical protein
VKHRQDRFCLDLDLDPEGEFEVWFVQRRGRTITHVKRVIRGQLGFGFVDLARYNVHECAFG